MRRWWGGGARAADFFFILHAYCTKKKVTTTHLRTTFLFLNTTESCVPKRKGRGHPRSEPETRMNTAWPSVVVNIKHDDSNVFFFQIPDNQMETTPSLSGKKLHPTPIIMHPQQNLEPPYTYKSNVYKLTRCASVYKLFTVLSLLLSNLKVDCIQNPFKLNTIFIKT